MRNIRIGTIGREMLVAQHEQDDGDRSSAETPRRMPTACRGYELTATYPPFTVWTNPELMASVLSSVDFVDEPEPSLQWHVSITRIGQAGPLVADDALVRTVLEDFDMSVARERAEEDNHVPFGKARNFWLPVPEHLRGVPCPCKASETPHRRGAYTWRDVPQNTATSETVVANVPFGKVANGPK